MGGGRPHSMAAGEARVNGGPGSGPAAAREVTGTGRRARPAAAGRREGGVRGRPRANLRGA